MLSVHPSLLRDPLMSSVDYNRLHNLIERVYISGDVNGPDPEEKEIIENMFNSKVNTSHVLDSRLRMR